MRSLVVAKGAHNRLCPSLARGLYHRLTLTANARRFVPVPDLAIALVDATSLERPVLLSRWLPPTQNFCRGASNANFNHVGASNLTLLLGGVVTYARLDDTSSPLPPSLHI